jgi:hypothetical protein
MTVTMLLMAGLTMEGFSNGPSGLGLISFPGLFVVALTAGSGISETTGVLIAVAVNLALVSIPFLIVLWLKSKRITVANRSQGL